MSEYDGPRIPDGSYQRVLTQKDVKQHGITATLEELEFAPDGTLINNHRFLGDLWVQRSDYNGHPPSVGAQGKVTYDSRGGLILDEECCGRSRYTWRLDGDKLVIVPDLKFAKAEHAAFDPRSEEVRIWKMMSSGTFTRVE